MFALYQPTTYSKIAQFIFKAVTIGIGRRKRRIYIEKSFM